MQPASYQRTAELNRQHDMLGLDSLLNPSQAMYCEKCGYVSSDPAVFNKHMLEHLATKYYCFYCNHVSYSKAELHVHLEQHTTKYPYTCQYCGLGYMREDLLLSHIRCLHVNPPSKGLNKPEAIKNHHAPVPSALPRVTINTSSMRPLVRVTAPLLPPPARMEKGRQGSKVVDTHLPSGPKVGETVLSCTGQHMQHNRALTVSLPDEVSIPAGCLVELIEVKTVNGTKELKLRIVSQQGDEATTKDTRSISSQNATFGKPLSSTSKNPNTQSVSAAMCMVNRKLSETNTLNAERPAVPTKGATSIPNSTSRGVCGTKRTLKEMLDSAQCLTVHPPKVAKYTPNTVTEGTRAIKISPQETSKANGAYPTISLVKPPCNLSISNVRSLTSNMPYKTNGLILENPASVSTRNASQPKIHIQPVKGEQGRMNQDRTTQELLKLKHDYALFLQKQQGLSVLRATNGQETLSVCKDKVSVEPSLRNPNDGYKPSISPIQIRPSISPIQIRPSVSPIQIRLPKMGEDSTLKSQKPSAWTQSRRCNGTTTRPIVGDTQEPKGFPVISNVFSLCPQPVQGTMQPLVKALQGIVMSKSNSPVTIPSVSAKTSNIVTGQKEKPIVSASCARVVKGDVAPHKTPVTQETSNAVKLENDACSRLAQTSPRNLSKLRKEGKINSLKDTKKYGLSPAPKSHPITAQDAALSNTAFNKDAPSTHSIPGTPPHLSENIEDASSKFLTVSLRRIGVGWWKPQKKRLRPSEVFQFKAQPHIDTSSDNAILCPAPLKVDQLVKRPGPNQPVVVLNHPKPQRSPSITDTGTSDVLPKCQILKMRLGKVMGHKYEVIGCTVRVFS